MSEQTDEDLVRQLALGSEDAFKKLFDRYYARVLHAGERYWGSKQMSHDLARDVFTRVWEERNELPYKGSIGQLLSEITWEEIKRINEAVVNQQSMFPSSFEGKNSTGPVESNDQGQ